MTNPEEEKIMQAFEAGATEYNGQPILQALGGLVLNSEVHRIMREPLEPED